MTIRLFIGDCRDVLRTLPDESVHCVVTSPPYWGLRDYGVAGQLGLEASARRGWHGGDLKPKDLCGIPWRVAFALQADGWWLRQDIIWSKPNPMPKSVTDRCTKAHEYLFLLSKSERYYYDADAIAEPAKWSDDNRAGEGRLTYNGKRQGDAGTGNEAFVKISDVRNKRSVWEVTTQPFSEAHFATFPPALIEPCILAGCPSGGTVLDPFGGAGTTGLVADRHGRNAILIELNPEYAAMAERRIHGDCPLFVDVTAEPWQNDDYRKSIGVAFDAVKDRMANGGEPWTPKAATQEQDQ